MIAYAGRIWDARHFWMHLAASDLRHRFRRSRLGMVWALAQPLGMACLIGLVFGAIFKMDWREYVPFILSGLLVWEFIATCASAGCGALAGAAPYIQQQPLPLAIYPLRLVIGHGVVKVLGLTLILAWSLVGAGHWDEPGFWLSLPFAAFGLTATALLGWGLATVSALVNVRFRDYEFAVPIALMAAWYLSPVMIAPTIYENAGLGILLTINPIAHLFEVIRAPLLHAHAPPMASVAVAGGLGALAVLGGSLALWGWERRTVHYL